MISEQTQLKQTLQKLPIYSFKNHILEAIHSNDVIVICGQTGCGKTTQVPKYIVQSNIQAKLIVTQPRRIAAVSVASRVAYQMNAKLGGTVGYHIGMQCKANVDSKITYVTDGIFLQKLTNDEKFLESYTHFIFDEIHERGIQCDFSLIAIKLFLAKNQNSKIKIILMSATLNSKMFSEYFSKDKLGNFIRATYVKVPQKIEENRNRRGQRDIGLQFQNHRYISKLNIKPEDKPAVCISLPTIRKFKIDIKYIDDLDIDSERNLYFSQEPNFESDTLFDIGINICKQYSKFGDILIFVPGMRQIRLFSDRLKQLNNNFIIIQLHSHLAGGIYEQLFRRSQNRAKIIISTNMAQSSITLPDCKIVIDYCMSKQMYYDQKKNFQRLDLCWASRASTIQRAGRVGRVSDGIVFRIISKEKYSKLSQYDYPQIKRCPLEKLILKIKKLELLNKNNSKSKHKFQVFQNPYEVLGNAFQPPQLNQINQSIRKLIEQQALMIGQKNDPPEFKDMKYNGSNLQITKFGQYVSVMPCDLKVSKMLLLSIELGCLQQIIDISGIFHYKKPFFLAYEKRRDKEEFMNMITEYDSGDFSDFKLKQRIFSEWRDKYFIPWKQKNIKRYQSKKRLQDVEDQQNYYETQNGMVIEYSRLINDFSKTPARQDEIKWCSRKSLYAKNMRQILLARESLKLKLLRERLDYKNIQSRRQDRQLAIDICLFLGFKGFLIEITLNKYENKKMDLKVYEKLNLNPKKTLYFSKFQKNIADYKNYVKTLDPKTLIFQQENGGLYVQSDFLVLAKYCLPYKKKEQNTSNNCSQFFNQLIKNEPYYPYKIQAKDILTSNEVIIDNESINKTLFYRSDHLGYLITNEYFINNSMVIRANNCSYINSIQAIFLILIFFNNIRLITHKSNEFFSAIKIFNYRKELKVPFFLDAQTIIQIKEIKQVLKSMNKMDNQLPNDYLLNKFQQLFYQSYQDIPPQQVWQKIFDKMYFKKIVNSQYSFQDVLKEQRLKNTNYYFQDYRKWKRQILRVFESLNDLRFQSCGLICRQCYSNNKIITEVFDLESLIPQKKCFMNSFFHEWKDQNNDILCSKNHKIGVFINQTKQIKLIKQDKLLIRYPKLSVTDFSFNKLNLKEIKDRQNYQRNQIFQERENRRYQCCICVSQDNQYQKLIFKNWIAYRKHIGQDKVHIANFAAFKKQI